MANEVEIAIIATDAASNIIEKIAGEFGALGEAGIAAVTAITGAFGMLIKAGSEAQDTQALFNAVIDRSPMKQYKEDLLQLAAAYSKTTRFEDDNIIAAETVLLRYDNLGDKIKQMVPLTLDFATAMKMDATSAAQQLGKALEDIAGGSLSLLGRTRLLTKEQVESAKKMAAAGDNAKAQAYIIDILTKKVGGLAVEMGDTFAGKWEKFSNSLKMTAEDLGMKLLPALSPIMDKLTTLAEELAPVLAEIFDQKVVPAFTAFMRIIDDFSKGDWAAAFEHMGTLWDFLTKDLRAAFDKIDWNVVGDAIANGIRSIDWNKVGLAISAGVQSIADKLNEIDKAVDWDALFGAAWNAFLQFASGLAGYKWDDVVAMWTGLVATFTRTWELLPVAVGLVFDQIRNVILTAVGVINSWVIQMGEEIVTALLGPIGKLPIVQQYIKSLGTTAEITADAMDNRIIPSFAELHHQANMASGEIGDDIKLLQKIDGMEAHATIFIDTVGGGGLGGLFGGGGTATYSPLTGGYTPGKKPIGMASGGPVQGGQPYVVGENGMEAFIPSQSGTIVPSSNITMNNYYGPVYQGGGDGGSGGAERMVR